MLPPDTQRLQHPRLSEVPWRGRAQALGSMYNKWIAIAKECGVQTGTPI